MSSRAGSATTSCAGTYRPARRNRDRAFGHDASAAQALEGLDNPKQFAANPNLFPHDTVRAAALGRIHHEKDLGSVARHAGAPPAALDASPRLGEGPNC